MSILASVSNPTEPKTKESQTAALALAAVFSIMAVCQLFYLDGFLKLFEGFGIFGGQTLMYIICCLLIALEVFSLPFLLSLRVSPLLRFSSMINSWIVLAVWLFIGYWVATPANGADNAGFLGTVVSLTPGLWTILMPIALGILAAWASWGMWPKIPRNKLTK